MNSKSIADMRISYNLFTLGDREVLDDPIDQFRLWWGQIADDSVMEANAMALSTVSADGVPQTRMVLMKDFDADGLVFYTNYGSAKAEALATNPNVCALFYWPSFQRQVRWTGVISKASAEESDAYFRIRPRGSQLGAWASDQSTPISEADELRARFEEFESKFANLVEIPRPDNWGGYRIRPTTIEFWQGRENRLHDRILFTRADEGDWLVSRLAP